MSRKEKRRSAMRGASRNNSLPASPRPLVPALPSRPAEPQSPNQPSNAPAKASQDVPQATTSTPPASAQAQTVSPAKPTPITAHPAPSTPLPARVERAVPSAPPSGHGTASGPRRVADNPYDAHTAPVPSEPPTVDPAKPAPVATPPAPDAPPPATVERAVPSAPPSDPETACFSQHATSHPHEEPTAPGLSEAQTVAQAKPTPIAPATLAPAAPSAPPPATAGSTLPTAPPGGHGSADCSPGAADNPYNRHAAPTPSQAVAGQPQEYANTQILDIASVQKDCLWIILWLLLTTAATYWFYPAVALNLLALHFFFRFAKVLHSGNPWLCVILGLVPLVNLISLLVLNAKAISVLRTSGIHVGLRGSDKRDLDDIDPYERA